MIWMLHRSTIGLRAVYHRRRGSIYRWRTTTRARNRHIRYTMFFILIKNLALRANYFVACRHLVLTPDCPADSYRRSYYRPCYHVFHQLLP